jgi:phosphoadenosine phosphosulfate reductase
MTINHANAQQWATDYEDKTPQEILALALDNFPDAAISFSGAEDVVLVDMAAKLGKPFRVFSLDTGRLHAETYQFIEKVRNHYKVAISRFAFLSRHKYKKWLTQKACLAFM